MASKLTSADMYRVGVQSDADSIPFDDNFQNLKNKINEVIDDVNSITETGTIVEVSNARPYHTNLKNRLDSNWSGQANYLKEGGVVSIASSAVNAQVTAGEAKINGIDVKWDAATSGVISLCVSDTRFDVVVINSDSTLQVVTGSEAANPVLPSVSSTQKALWVLAVTTVDITASWDARDQGCWYYDEGRYKYSWYIQDAIDDITSGDIRIGKGTYYETLTYKTSVNLIFEGGATVYSSLGVKQGDVTNTKILGEIIAIHPDVKAAFLPNTYEYALCDGATLLPTTVFDVGNDTYVPDLTDDRFLMGDTAYGTGGTNTQNLSLDNTQVNNITGFVDYTIGSLSIDGPIGRFNIAAGAVTMYRFDNKMTNVENRPLYFSVLYYIRIR